MGIAVTATRSSTTEPMLVGDAFTSSCGAARGARNLISRDLSACRSRRGDWASSPDVVLSPVWLSESASNEGGVEFSSRPSSGTRIDLCTQVAALIGAFDRSNLIFTRRSNDLIFQTAAIKLFLPKARRRRYADFSYQHHTITNGAVLYGGIESGWRDRRARHTLRAYAHKHVGAHRDRDPATGLRTNWTTPDLRVRSCHVQEHVDGPFRPTYYVAPPHDATQAHRQRPPNFIAPFCGPGRPTVLE